MLFISFIFIPAFLLGWVAEAEALGGLGISLGQQHFQIVLLALHQNETKQGRRCSYETYRPWMTSEPLFRGFS